MELIILIIKLIVKAFDKDGGATAAQKQAWEQAAREWRARQEQWARDQQAAAAPVAVPPPVPAAGGRVARRVVKKVAPPPLPRPGGGEIGSEPGAFAPAARSAAARLPTGRQQVILAEVLKPPVALRPPRW